MAIRAELTSETSIRLYRDELWIGGVVLNGRGWKSYVNSFGTQYSRVPSPSAQHAAMKRWGAAGRDAVDRLLTTQAPA